MITLEHTVISDDIKDEFFVCDLAKCKGACCTEGDLGAPLEEEEIKIIEADLEKIRPFLSSEGQKVIDNQGVADIDPEGGFCTTVIEDKDCAFSVWEKGILKCGIEKAYRAGKTDFIKPISCHLYPIRVTKYDDYDALNYHRWQICNPACDKGSQLGVPLYKFLKEPLIRKYGEKWYEKLIKLVEPS